jgi:hypothetical protein
MQKWFKSLNILQHINRSKGKGYMIILKDAQRVFDKIQHPFLTKALMKLGIEGLYLNIMKAAYDKHIINIILKRGKLKIFLLK